MASRAVGLDIGTHAVRAAELSIGRGDQATLTRFGQVALPVGAVTDGEVVDPPAVAAAIRRLWTEAGFKGREVIVGVANQRVIVRQAEVPAMTEQDLRAALQFEVQELIPIPVEEAILDFQILEQFLGPEQEPMMRILLVAAQRDMVRSLLAAVEGAGLGASMVDLVPFALIRSLVGTDLGLDRHTPADAIVSVGGGVTNVVVHEGGLPRFVRTLITGGNEITAAIAADLGVDFDEAEDVKRRANAASPDPQEATAGRILSDRLLPFVEEVRGSVDYYRAQAPDGDIGRVLLTGGGSRAPGLVDGLQAALGVPIEMGHPLLAVRVGRTGISEDRLVDSEPLLAVPIGLALGGRAPESGGRRMSLLPTEVAAVRAQRRQVGVVAAALAALAVLLVALWLGRTSQVTGERDQAERTESQAARLRQQANQLGQVTTVEAQLNERRRQVQLALADDVGWTRLVQEIAQVLPSDVWLTNFQGQKSGGATATGAQPAQPSGGAAAAPTSGVGTVNVTGMGFDQSSAARWLLRVGDLQSLTGVWLPSSTKGPGNAPITFTSTADLTDRVRTGQERVQQYVGAQG